MWAAHRLDLGIGIAARDTPVVTPALTLDLTSTLPASVTFTRASSATYTNASGTIATATTDAARFDYNPDTLAAKGLLIEESRTNAAFYSAALSGWPTGWSTTSADVVAAPDGATAADKIIGSVESNPHAVYRTDAPSVPGILTLSAYMKAAEYSYGCVSHTTVAGTRYGAVFSLTDGSFVAAGSEGAPTNTGYFSTSQGGGFYRLAVKTEETGTGSSGNPGIAMNDDGTVASWLYGLPVFTGNGTSGVYAWGAQLENGAFPTSYIPTTSASVTRAADVATMTGSNFSSWWTAAQGTIVVEADSPGSGTRVVWQADDGTANNRITIWTDGTTAKCDVVSGGVTQTSLSLGTITANTAFRIAIRYGANDFAGCLNGGTVQTDTGGTVPTVDRCRLGSSTAGDYLCGHIAAVSAYATGLTNAQLQSETAA